MNVENLKAFFTPERIQKRVDIYEGFAVKNPPLLGATMFPKEPVPDLKVLFEESIKTLIPMGYSALYQGSEVLSIPQALHTYGVTLAKKSNKDSINEHALDWLKRSGIKQAIQHANAWKSVTKQISDFMGALYTRNEIENWQLLTSGTITTLHGQTLSLPFEGMNFDYLKSLGIAFHEVLPWFDADGEPDVDRNPFDDLKNIKKTVQRKGGNVPVRAVMNSTTAEYFYKNTMLNTTEMRDKWQPMEWARAINLSNPTLFNIDWVVYDEVYYNPITLKATPYIPDYVVVFLPRSVGWRPVAPNDWNGSPSAYGHSFAPEGTPTLWFDVGEVSLPLPNDLRSPYVVYTKPLPTGDTEGEE